MGELARMHLRGQAAFSQSFRTAIRTFSVRARSSLCFLLFVSILALSVIFDDTSPKGRGF